MELIVLIGLGIFIYYQIKIKPQRKNNIPVNELDRMVLTSESIVSNKINKIKKFAEKKISLSYLTGYAWSLQNTKIIYTFRNNSELLITDNGIVEKCRYELIIDNNSILITKKGITELYNILNIENDFLYLHRVSTNETLVFHNQTKSKDDLKQMVQQEVKNGLNLIDEIEQIKNENEFIKSDPDTQSLCMGFQRTWEMENSNKSILDYLAFLQNNSFYNNYDFEKWKESVIDGNEQDYINYLIYKKHIKQR